MTSENSTITTIPLAGFKPEDVVVTVRGRQVSIKADQKQATSHHSLWRSYKSTYILPEGFQYNKVEARLKDNKLILEAPKQIPATNNRSEEDNTDPEFEHRTSQASSCCGCNCGC